MDHICETCRHFLRLTEDEGECRESSPQLTHVLIPVEEKPNILTGQTQRGFGIRGFAGWPGVSPSMGCGRWTSPFKKETVQ